MSNSTSSSSSSVRYQLYIIEGTLSAISNILACLTILRHQSLRSKKEYVIIFGLSLADCLNGIGTAALGGHRLTILKDGVSQVSRRACFFLPAMQILIHSSMAQALMLLMVSVDRLVSISLPLQYYGFGTFYAISLISVAFLLPFIKYFAALAVVWNDTEPVVSSICYFPNAMSTAVYDMTFLTQILIASASIVLYGVVLMRYRQKMAQVEHVAYGGNQEQKQKRFTISLAISCFFTLLLYVVPYSMLLLAPHVGNDLNLGTSAVILANINPTLNIFIYSIRLHEFRRGFWAMLTCKKLVQPSTANVPAVALVQVAQLVMTVRYYRASEYGKPRIQTIMVRNKESKAMRSNLKAQQPLSVMYRKVK